MLCNPGNPAYFLLSSVIQSCPTLCDPMDCSTPGFHVHHQLLEFTKLMSIESVMPSSHLIVCHPPFSSCLQSFLASGSFPMSQLFTSGHQSMGVSASASVLPMNTQGTSSIVLIKLLRSKLFKSTHSLTLPFFLSSTHYSESRSRIL